MTFRFEEEDFAHNYALEDFYCTNPFCDCQHTTISLYDAEKNFRISFLLNFNKTHSLLPGQEKLGKTHTDIVKGFVKNMQEGLLILFKQRYLEAKAYGEKNPMSYLVFEPGKFINYMEMFPMEAKLLDFSCDDQKMFAEDSYDVDSRTSNKSVRLSFFKDEAVGGEQQEPTFNYMYYFDETLRAEEDKKLGPKEGDILLALNSFIPNVYDILKVRYKQAKDLGKTLMAQSRPDPFVDKVNRNDLCPCGSGKKYKKCCALKMH
jgi:hypothetical protein